MILDKRYIRQIVKTSSRLVIKVKNNIVYLITTNDTDSFVIDCPLEGEAVEFIVDQKKFIGITNNLEVVNIAMDGDYKIKLWDDNNKFTLAVMTNETAADTDKPEEHCLATNLPFKHLLSTVADRDQLSSASVRESIFITSEYMASTNGVSITITNEGLDIEDVLIPKSLFNHIEEGSNISVKGNFVHITKDNKHYYGTSLYGQFPDVKSIASKVEYVNHFIVNRDDLLGLLNSCAPLIGDELKVAEIDITNRFELKLENDISSFESSIPVSNTATFSCSLDVEILKKIIEPFEREDIKIYFADKTTPIKIEGDNLIKLMILSYREK